MLRIDFDLTPAHLKALLERLFELSAAKLRTLAKAWDPSRGAPVVTVQGAYTSRAWTEWTQGFQFGSALLQFEATGEPWFLNYGRDNTLRWMASRVSHTGVHDHGFNIISTYGNLLRLAREGGLEAGEFEKHGYELALKVSGAVQAARWSATQDGRGYIYSFSGPHSLFIDTLRSLRSLAVAHRLGHVLLGESEECVSLLARLVQHASVTADYAVYYGEGRDLYDVRGRVAHESVFNVNDGSYRCPGTQQGYSPYSTWTRGLAWAMLGFAEELEFLEALPAGELEALGGQAPIHAKLLRAARATGDYYLEQTPTDGVPYWDTHAPNLSRMPDYLDRPSDPFNDFEPVDSSAAVIAAQAFWRLARLVSTEDPKAGKHYRQASLTLVKNLLDKPYLSEEPSHQGLILHALYHRPKGWDYVPSGRKIPCGEACMWGDYHARELALLLLREIRQEAYLSFFAI